MDRDIGLYAIVISAVAILVGLAFYPAFAGNIGQMTQTSSINNFTYTLPAVNVTTDVPLCGQKILGTPILINATSGIVVPSGNYTISQGIGTDGYLSARIKSNDVAQYASRSVNFSCSYEPKGYINDGGSRGIVGLIAIFMALLIVVAALPNVRNGIMDFFRG